MMGIKRYPMPRSVFDEHYAGQLVTCEGWAGVWRVTGVYPVLNFITVVTAEGADGGEMPHEIHPSLCRAWPEKEQSCPDG